AQAAAADFSAGVFQLDLHFAHGFFAFGHSANSVVGETRFDLGQLLDCTVNRIDGAVADGNSLADIAVSIFECDGCGGDRFNGRQGDRAAGDLQTCQLEEAV